MDLYYNIPLYPDYISGTTILIRLLDGLGFRFRWSTENLTYTDYSFRPGPDSMSIEELVRHVWGLINWVCQSMLTEKFSKPDDIILVRHSILEMIFVLRDVLVSMNDKDLMSITINKKPFWHIINGPIADALTHVGQINSFRRLAGNPTSKANVFIGLHPNNRNTEVNTSD
jgi:hypothetical protein